jgi:hypothetical protein
MGRRLRWMGGVWLVPSCRCTAVSARGDSSSARHWTVTRERVGEEVVNFESILVVGAVWPLGAATVVAAASELDAELAIYACQSERNTHDSPYLGRIVLEIRLITRLKDRNKSSDLDLLDLALSGAFCLYNDVVGLLNDCSLRVFGLERLNHIDLRWGVRFICHLDDEVM